MQELKILLKNGHTVSIRCSAYGTQVAPEFNRFLDEFRLSRLSSLSGNAATEKIFEFTEPRLLVNVSEVCVASVEFFKGDAERTADQNMTAQAEKDRKGRSRKRTVTTEPLN